MSQGGKPSNQKKVEIEKLEARFDQLRADFREIGMVVPEGLEPAGGSWVIAMRIDSIWSFLKEKFELSEDDVRILILSRMVEALEEYKEVAYEDQKAAYEEAKLSNIRKQITDGIHMVPPKDILQ